MFWIVFKLTLFALTATALLLLVLALPLFLLVRGWDVDPDDKHGRVVALAFWGLMLSAALLSVLSTIAAYIS